ncbi:MAG: hypothetical protein AB7S38_08525 [Vulcanimicrobiota bacterium]
MAFPIHDGGQTGPLQPSRPPALERITRALEEGPRVPRLNADQSALLREFQSKISATIARLREVDLPSLPDRPLLPRSGWKDPEALQKALAKSRRLVRQSENNWRRRIDDLTGPSLPWRLRGRLPAGPGVMPMYGMPNPGHDHGPDVRPMYGAPMPNEPGPGVMPMYGMPNPPHTEGPDITPMYGAPMPPVPDFPEVAPMYGAPMPPRDQSPDVRPMYGMPVPSPTEPSIHPMYGMPIPGEELPHVRPMYGLPRP